jgi:hypothetical protein
MMWYPDTIDAHRAEINAVERIISDLAAQRRIITYRELSNLEPRCNFRTEHAILEVISHRTQRARGVMLTAVVVGAYSDIPGDGFFNCARDLGRAVGAPREFHRHELARVFREYEGWVPERAAAAAWLPVILGARASGMLGTPVPLRRFDWNDTLMKKIGKPASKKAHGREPAAKKSPSQAQAQSRQLGDFYLFEGFGYESAQYPM